MSLPNEKSSESPRKSRIAGNPNLSVNNCATFSFVPLSNWMRHETHRSIRRYRVSHVRIPRKRDARCAIRVRLARQKGGKPFGLVRRKKNPPRRKRMEKRLEPRRPSIFARKAHRRIPWTQAGRLRPRINHGKGREKKAVLSLPRFSLDLLLPDRNLVAWDTGQRKG